ncbi:MAG: TIR domain-containing protein [Bacteroidota bacterium]|nr:TIR domain-containing protein [Bacteroidota bacterium]MDP4233576.1 TIR domain-containing protein [Bacteroidota bacterium]MDP4243650.1 TIR domain-containing protein [Bacteroidota bacterium]MDP4287763.1 TIR domain-containing protein [Bacteroidota bacterium]
MSDIFISYSRRDSMHALGLAERLRAEGYSIWMDQTGISGAEKWSAEIVDALEAAHTVILLVSNDSNSSVNVHREISIASEHDKKILPVDIESIPLSRELKYPLAGLQRLPIADVDAVLRSLRKLGVPVATSTLEATPAPKKDARKSLMVLPFEDQSPGQDNGWFADGLMSELIATLSSIRSLRLIDQRTSLEYRGLKTKIAEIARALDVRYFIEGSVRKFGEQIKVTVQLLDAESGEHLWTDSLRGEFKDIFDIQEQVAAKVLGGLKLKLTEAEAKQLSKQATQNPEAYELFLRAQEYMYSDTANQMKAKSLLERVIELDPNAVAPYTVLAGLLSNLGQSIPNSQEEIRRLIMTALRIDPMFPGVYAGLASLHIQNREYQQALDMAKKMHALAPERHNCFAWLGFCYIHLKDWSNAALNYEKAFELEPLDAHYANHLVGIYLNAGDHAMLKRRASEWLQIQDRFLARFPDAPDSLLKRLILRIETQPREQWLIDLKDVSERPRLDPQWRASLALSLAHFDTGLAIAQLRRAFDEGLIVDGSLEDDSWPEEFKSSSEFRTFVAEIESKAKQ